jgi:predicted nucleic acid-binding protein
MQVLLDTNVLVYLYDYTAELKQRQALAVVAELEERGCGAVSTQVLAEFFSVTTSRFRHRISVETALEQLERHSRVWTVLAVTTPVILAAARAVQAHQLNFWDTQLWAVAKLNGVETILSEDFNSGSSLQGVRFINPFAPGFRLPSSLF